MFVEVTSCVCKADQIRNDTVVGIHLTETLTVFCLKSSIVCKM